MSTCHAMLKVHRVVSIQVHPSWNTKRVARPEGKGFIVCWNAEGVCMLSQSIDVGICRDTSFDSNVLWCKDDWMIKNKTSLVDFRKLHIILD